MHPRISCWPELKYLQWKSCCLSFVNRKSHKLFNIFTRSWPERVVKYYSNYLNYSTTNTYMNSFVIVFVTYIQLMKYISIICLQIRQKKKLSNTQNYNLLLSMHTLKSKILWHDLAFLLWLVNLYTPEQSSARWVGYLKLEFFGFQKYIVRKKFNLLLRLG